MLCAVKLHHSGAKAYGVTKDTPFSEPDSPFSPLASPKKHPSLELISILEYPHIQSTLGSQIPFLTERSLAGKKS